MTSKTEKETTDLKPKNPWTTASSNTNHPRSSRREWRRRKSRNSTTNSPCTQETLQVYHSLLFLINRIKKQPNYIKKLIRSPASNAWQNLRTLWQTITKVLGKTKPMNTKATPTNTNYNKNTRTRTRTQNNWINNKWTNLKGW